MAEKKFLTLPRLTEYDGLIKDYINTGLAGKSASSHNHDSRYYTESEIDTKLSDINTNIDKVTSGETVVSKATSATYAESATNASTATYASNAAKATNATSATNASTAAYATKAKNADTATYASSANTATSATSATNAGTATYANSAGTANKLGSSTVGSATKPVYIKDGVATTCTTYAGGTKLTVNGSNKGGSSAAIFAPTTGGTAGQVLKSAGTGSAPVWETLDVYTKAETDTAINNKTKGMATTATVDSKISTHNGSTASHSDIRATLAEVKEDVDAFFKDATISEAAKDTLKEIQEYIASDVEAAAAMTASINNKSDKGHGHEIADVNGLQSALDGKAASSHGTHVTWSTTSPKMNGTASVGSETKVSRGDHIHPVDTSRAAKTDFDAHVASTVSHVTASERTKWNAKASTASATTATAGLMTAAMVTKLNGIAEGANKYTLPTATTATFGGVKSGSTVTSTSGLTAAPIISGIPYYKDTNTTYKAGTGIALSGTTFSNAGVRSVVTGSTNGTIIVNTNGTTASVPVKGLGAAAYLAMDSSLSTSSTNPVQNKAVANAINTLSSAVNANTDSISTHTSVISDLQTAVNEIQEITSAEIQQLFQS